MSQGSFNLAFETSSRLGSVTLGREDQLLATRWLPPQARHRVDLLPVTAELCRAHEVKPQDIGELYVSCGPGSFTGLRIGIATAKTLALVTGTRLVAVSTLEVVAMNVPVRSDTTLVVALNLKKETVYAGVYRACAGDRAWRQERLPALTRLSDLLATLSGPVLLVGEKLSVPEHPATQRSAGGLTYLADAAQPQSDQVWHLGRRLAAQGQYARPHDLLPLYARLPEAVELWEKRQATSSPTTL